MELREHHSSDDRAPALASGSRFDFDTVPDRRGSGSLKWDVADGELPMWVADMDFPTAPPIIEAITAKAKQGVFGYSITPPSYRRAVATWYETRHGLKLDEAWIRFSSGVIPAVSSIIRCVTEPGDKVLIQSPVYNIFYNSINNNGRSIVESELVYENGTYRIDWEDLETKLSDPSTTMMLLCNPHNPIGRAWDADTLREIDRLCIEHGVTVLSDEIHGDLTDPGVGYVPHLAVSDVARSQAITCVSPSKTFNIAGIQSASVIIPDKELRDRIAISLNADEIAEPNVFAMDATIAAYTLGAPWLDGLRSYVKSSRDVAYEYIARHIPALEVVEANATYLMWIDCSRVSDDSRKLVEHLRASTGLILCPGVQYGECGKSFVRLNLATSRDLVLDGLDRLRRGIDINA